MHYLATNLKWLRTKHELRQSDLAEQLGLTRSALSSYEEQRAEPSIQLLTLMAQRFSISLDQLLLRPLDGSSHFDEFSTGKSLRVLPIVVEKTAGDERVVVVPLKARAGYLRGAFDTEFVQRLPTVALPFHELPRQRTYRMFQIEGDSMWPVPSGAYVIASYVQNWNEVVNEQCYIVVSRAEGIVFKRLLNNLAQGHLVLKSDNPRYEPMLLEAEQLQEVWRAEGYAAIGFQKPTQPDLESRMRDIEGQLQRIEQKLSP